MGHHGLRVRSLEGKIADLIFDQSPDETAVGGDMHEDHKIVNSQIDDGENQNADLAEAAEVYSVAREIQIDEEYVISD